MKTIIAKRKDTEMAKMTVTKKITTEKAVPAKVAANEKVKETKESKLVKLLSSKEFYTLKEIMAKTGFAEASARMYTSAEYLKRKAKPYKIVIGTKGKETAFRLEATEAKK